MADFLIAIPVGMVAYTGIETISNMAEEARDYGKTIPRAMGAVVFAVAVIYAVPAGGRAVGDAGRERRDRARDRVRRRPRPRRCREHGPGGARAAEIYVGVLAATILFIATNAGLIGVSRLTYSMGQHRQLPEALRALHPQFRTPYVAIMVFGAIACVTILPGQADFLGVIYAFGAMLSFTMAHLAVIKLRLTLPEPRAAVARAGQHPVAGRSLPLFAVFGGIGTGLAWIVVTALDVRVLVSGLVWLAIGISTYVVYRRRLGLSLTDTVKMGCGPEAMVEHEVEYQSVLVAFEDWPLLADAVRDRGALAARRRRGIHVLVTITVPNSSPIDAPLPEQEARAQE